MEYPIDILIKALTLETHESYFPCVGDEDIQFTLKSDSKSLIIESVDP
jgi:hypothetical protein